MRFSGSGAMLFNITGPNNKNMFGAEKVVAQVPFTLYPGPSLGVEVARGVAEKGKSKHPEISRPLSCSF